MPIVVGIFPNNAAVSSLADSLKSGGYDLAAFTVISTEEAPEPLITSGVRFVLSGEAEESTLAGGSALITGHGGPDVPGLSKTEGDVGSIEDDPLLEALSDLSIPDGRTDDYTDALDEGRVVAGLNTPDADKAKALFTAAGATDIEVF